MSAIAVARPATRRLPAWADRGLDAVIIALLVALLLGLGMRALGLTALVDYTDSMRPAIAAGDVILDETVTAGDLRPGQIASIADPGANGRLITHRVVSVSRSGPRVTVLTRGDANADGERWTLRADAPTKRMIARIPWIGHVMAWLGSAPLRGIALALAALAVLWFGARRALVPRPPDAPR